LLGCFFLFAVAGCARHTHLANVQVTPYYVDNEQSTTKRIDSLVAPYKLALDAEMNAPIGRVAEQLDLGKPESTLGNWLADALYEQTKKRSDAHLDFALLNYGGVRVPFLSKGPVTKGNIFELMPFDNGIVIIELDATTLELLLNRMAMDGGWPASQQLHYAIRAGKIENAMIKGQPITQNRTYAVALSDYVANGGDKCPFLKDKPRRELGTLLRDAFLEAVRETDAKGETIEARLDGRARLFE
jgi:2',3'-cyclic-nucleotide 2'-phosphodiesterase (5'-nucleotidase family)